MVFAVVMSFFVVVLEPVNGCLDRLEILFSLLVVHVSLAPFGHNLFLEVFCELHGKGGEM